MSETKGNTDTTTEKAAPDASSAATTGEKTWTSHYESAKDKLPTALSSRLPTSEEASRALEDMSKRFSAFGASTSEKWTVVSKSTSERIDTLRQRGGLTKEQFFAHSYSVANASEIPLSISLNQVGPLYYEVVKPGDTFERRVPGLYYMVEVRPYCQESDAYTTWSVTWPILALAGPVSAAASLLAIPVVALAAGGSALASLTTFGSSVASGVSTTTSAVATGTATVAKWGTRATMLPKVRTKLIDASTNLVNEKWGEQIKARVVKYVTDSSENRKGEPEDAGEKADRERAEKELARKRATKMAEIDVTGKELEKVLRCETGDKKLDKELAKAFKKLEFKTSAFKAAKTNPVLAVCGGPTIEERDNKTFLVFYPLFLQKIAIEAQPLSLEEQPPTEDENAIVRDATVVEDVRDAEKIAQVAPKHADGSRDRVAQVGEEAISSAGTPRPTTPAS